MKKICITGFLAMTLAVHAQDGLKDVLGEHFLIGTSLNQWQSAGWEKRVVPIVRKHFNSIVAENCMKPEALQPTESVFTFKAADELMEFARRNGQSVVGHCLVWHSQTPPWFFTDKEGKPATREQLIARIRSHIHTVVGRYKGQVRGWDVVNEAFEDDGSWRRSPFYRIIGEKAAHLGTDLTGQRFIWLQDQRRAIAPGDDVRHRKRLAGAGDAQQRLGVVTLMDALHQRFYRLRLVAGGLKRCL